MTSLVIAAALVVSAAAAATPVVAADSPTTPSKAVDAAKRRLVKVLTTAERGAKPRTDARPGPAGTVLVRAFIPDAYPGTGVAAGIVGPGGRLYGKHFDADLAELARRLGWKRGALPSAEDAVKALHYARYDALLAVDPAPAPAVVARGDGGLRLSFVRREPLGRQSYDVVVELPATGPQVVKETARQTE